MFFADFMTVYVKMIIDFKNFLNLFFLDDHMVQGTSKSHKGVEKYIFHCFGDECCPIVE